LDIGVVRFVARVSPSTFRIAGDHVLHAAARAHASPAVTKMTGTLL
jgi:hypothetical protein